MNEKMHIQKFLDTYGLSMTAFAESIGEYRQKIFSRKKSGWFVEIVKEGREYKLVFTNPKDEHYKPTYSLKGVEWFKRHT